MWRFVWILIILIFSVWLGLQIVKDPGMAYFSYRHWSVEMPLWFAIVSLIIFIIVLFSIIRFLNQMDMSVYRWRNWLQWRRKNKSYSKTNRGLIEALEGHWKNAEYYLKEGLAQSDAPLLNYLVLAKSAHEQKAFERRDSYLRKAHAIAPQADIAIGLTQAQLQLNQGQLEQALATLDHLQHVSPHHALVLKLLERVYIHLGDWTNLLKLVPRLCKAKVVTGEQAAQLELKAYSEWIRSIANRSDHTLVLQNIWQNIPKKYRTHPEIVYEYVSQINDSSNEADNAEELIYKTLKKSWNKKLARLYGFIIIADSKKQLSHAENLLKQYGKQAILLLTLGRIAICCQLWGKARSYFEESLVLEANEETYLEYGKLLEQLGEINMALQSYRDGLLCVKPTSVKAVSA